MSPEILNSFFPPIPVDKEGPSFSLEPCTFLVTKISLLPPTLLDIYLKQPNAREELTISSQGEEAVHSFTVSWDIFSRF